LTQLQAERKADQSRLLWIQEAEIKLREAFEALAARSLQSTSDELLKRAKEQTEFLIGQIRGDLTTNKAELQGIVEPLKSGLKSLDTNVRELEQKREGAYRSLEEQMRELGRTHSSLQNTTLTLAQALKSQTARGRWGEIQLRRVVELANMVNHVDFTEQASADVGRPDMIIHLSNQGILPVDSKIPLNAYLEAVEAGDETSRRIKLTEHAKAMQARIRELCQRKYWDQFPYSPEFVVMFVPNEACLSAAFETDPSLLDYAIEQHVLIASPVTLLALLKAVAFGWQQTQIAESARVIANQGRELYQRMVTFVEHLAALGKSINRTCEDYNKAVASFEHRLFPAARRLQETGLSETNMELPEEIDTIAIQPVNPDNS
jgi:DNA recombination protein RmuC